MHPEQGAVEHGGVCVATMLTSLTTAGPVCTRTHSDPINMELKKEAGRVRRKMEEGK